MNAIQIGRTSATALLLMNAAAATHAQGIAQNLMLPCDLTLCGGYAQNVATMQVGSGKVNVDSTGRVQVILSSLRDKATGTVLANTLLFVSHGSFTYQQHKTLALGSITTDGLGNYSGYVKSDSGGDTHLANRSYAGSFIFNDYGRSQFITGFKLTASNCHVKPPGYCQKYPDDPDCQPCDTLQAKDD